MFCILHWIKFIFCSILTQGILFIQLILIALPTSVIFEIFDRYRQISDTTLMIHCYIFIIIIIFITRLLYIKYLIRVFFLPPLSTIIFRSEKIFTVTDCRVHRRTSAAVCWPNSEIVLRIGFSLSYIFYFRFYIFFTMFFYT